MNKVISFPNSDIKEYRQKCIFMNRAVQIVGEDGSVILVDDCGNFTYVDNKRFAPHFNNNSER